MTKLKEIRTNQNITQKKLAEISGVNIRMIQKYETGERDLNKAEVVTVYRLAKALDVPIEDLLTIKELEDK